MNCRSFFAALLASSVVTGVVMADDQKVLALVPKFMNHPFFELAHQGCIKAEKDLPGYKCEFIGPSEPDEQAQVQLLQDLITRKVAGIAISPSNAPAIGRVLKMAKDNAIPVITWDSDLLEADKTLRKTYIGTENYALGIELGKQLKELRPEGGIYALQTGGAAAANLNERMQGVRDALKDTKWKEAEGTPLYCNDDSTLALQQFTDLLSREPDLNAFVPVGGWPQVVQRGYRLLISKYENRLKDKSLVIVAADTMPMQLEILSDGLSHVQVGQRPTEMGYKSIMALKDLVEGKSLPDHVYTGLDVCTKANLGTCTK